MAIHEPEDSGRLSFSCLIGHTWFLSLGDEKEVLARHFSAFCQVLLTVDVFYAFFLSPSGTFLFLHELLIFVPLGGQLVSVCPSLLFSLSLFSLPANRPV